MAFVTFIVASIFALAGDISEMLFPTVVVLAIIWLIISVILNKGFKNIAKTGIQFVITAGIVLVLLVTNNKTQGFGVVYLQPDLNDIKSISTNYSGVFDNFGERWSNDIVATIDDDQYIKLFRETHKNILEEYKENKDTDEYMHKYHGNKQFNITYNLKNGKEMTRSYRVDSNMLEKLSSLDLTDEYIDQMIDYQIKVFEQQVEEHKHIPYFRCKPIIMNISLSTSSEFGVDSKETKSFFEAARKDLKSLSPEDYYCPSQKPICKLIINDFEIVVNENYTNVLNWLSSHMDIDEVEYTDSQIAEFYNNMSIGKYNNEDKNILISNSNSYHKESQSLDTKYKEYEKEDILALMQYAQPNYYSASDVYMMSYRNETYAVPAQYNDIAEKYCTEIVEEYLED